MSNETKIGLLAIVAIAISIWGYKYILGTNLLSSSNVFYAEYDNVDGLTASSPVNINGLQVGTVKSLTLKPENLRIVAELDIRNDIIVPKEAIAAITTTSVMGGKAVVLEFDKPCSGNTCAQSGDYLDGKVKGMLESMVGEVDVDSSIDKLKESALEISDTLMSPNSDIGKSLQDLRLTMQNLKQTTDQLNRLMSNSQPKINSILSNLDGLSTSLNQSNADIQRVMSNAAAFTDDLKKADISGTVANANQAIGKTGAALTELKSTIQSANKAVDGIQTFVNTLNTSDGTLGKLIQSDELYNNLDKTLKSVEKLSTDLQDKPYRYVPFKSKRRVDKYDKQAAEQN